MASHIEHLIDPQRPPVRAVLRALAAPCLLAGLLAASLQAQNLTFTNQNIASGTYQSAGSIKADAGNGSATTTISSGSSVIFEAGTTITLLPNFHASQGSSFQAMITSGGSGFTISGTVTAPSGCGISGVTVNLTGPQNAGTKTGGNGAYSFTVTTGGTYTVTPSQPPFVFNYSSINVTSSSPTANFLVTSPAIPAREYIRLGGRIVAVANCGAQ
jgi:hypothetical protein